MKKKIYIILWTYITITCSITNVFSSNIDSLFIKGNEMYRKGNYTLAIKLYDSILKQDMHSWQVYYNLANCYYKTNQLGKSIQFYEKSKKMDPNNENILNNLSIAMNKTVDKIEDNFSIQKSVQYFLFGWWDIKSWAICSISLSYLMCILFVVFYFFKNTTLKKISLTATFISFFLALYSLAGAYSQNHFLLNKKDGVLVVTNSYIKYAPASKSKDKFVLHEGTKVQILDKVDIWLKIRIADGKVGWIKEDHVGLI